MFKYIIRGIQYKLIFYSTTVVLILSKLVVKRNPELDLKNEKNKNKKTKHFKDVL